MPFKYKLSRRLAISHPVIVLVSIALACTTPDAPNDLGSDILQIFTFPPQATLAPAETRQFAAFGMTASLDSVPVLVTWNGTGGVVTSSGSFTAGSEPGEYMVIATHIQRTWLSDTSIVTIDTLPSNELGRITITPNEITLSKVRL